jgi:hypothetical protein
MWASEFLLLLENGTLGRNLSYSEGGKSLNKRIGKDLKFAIGWVEGGNPCYAFTRSRSIFCSKQLATSFAHASTKFRSSGALKAFRK